MTVWRGPTAPRMAWAACASGWMGRGGVVSVGSYRPFGSPLEGEGGAPYGFTGEWWEGDAGLLFLRARYYAPRVGIFLSQDPVPGTHLYMYVGANPINLIDPSGSDGTPPPPPRPRPTPPGTPAVTPVPTPVGTPTPIDPRQRLQNLIEHYRYLRTENYGWFDIGHANPKNRLFRDVRAAAKTGDEVQAGGRVRGPFEFYAYYWVEKLNDDQIEGVALGIFKDLSFRVEKWQGEFPFGFGEGTSFAIEDYPSNYIGFLAAVRNQGQATKVDSVELIIDYLGPVEWTNEPPPHSDTLPDSICEGLDPFVCVKTMERYTTEVKNYEFTPRIEVAPLVFENRPWPCNDLIIQPISSGPDTWHFIREEHNRGLKTYAEFGWNKIGELLDKITPW
jgi:RHS repeat-associated protein